MVLEKICACGNNTFRVVYDTFTEEILLICTKCENQYYLEFHFSLEIREATKDEYVDFMRDKKKKGEDDIDELKQRLEEMSRDPGFKPGLAEKMRKEMMEE